MLEVGVSSVDITIEDMDDAVSAIWKIKKNVKELISRINLEMLPSYAL